MVLILQLLRRINMRGKVFAKINHKLGIKTNLSTKGIEVTSFHIAFNVIMLIIYSRFNTFINFPIFSVLMDPLNKIPSIFNASGSEYPTREGIMHLFILTRKSCIKNCKNNFLGELMIGTF